MYIAFKIMFRQLNYNVIQILSNKYETSMKQLIKGI